MIAPRSRDNTVYGTHRMQRPAGESLPGTYCSPSSLSPTSRPPTVARLRPAHADMGACPPPLRGRSAVVARETPHVPLAGQRSTRMSIFRLDGRMQASRLHAPVKSEPVCGDHSARRRYMRAFQSQAIARNPTVVAREWWILGRCLDLPSMVCGDVFTLP